MNLISSWSRLAAGGPQRLAVPLGLFLAGFFLFPSSKSHNSVYYALVLAPALVLLRGADWRWLASSTLWRATAALLVYLTLSGLWSNPLRLGDWLLKAKALPYVLVYVAVVACVRARRPQHWEQILRVVVLAATCGTLVSVALFYGYGKMPSGARLEYYGAIYHPIEAASAVGSCLLLVLLHLLPTAHGWARRGFWLACALVLLGGIVLTGSRTPLAAVILCSVLGLALRQQWRLLGASALGAVLVLGGLAASTDLPEQARARGDSYRFAIWQHVAARVAQNPWFGEGILTDDSMQLAVPGGAAMTIDHPHNVYLATALYGGVPALLLLLALVGLALRQGWQLAARGEPVWLVMLGFALLCMLTDGAQLLRSPRAIWFYFWLPVGVLIGCQARSDQARSG